MSKRTEAATVYKWHGIELKDLLIGLCDKNLAYVSIMGW
jgi:hypothetical protein